MGLFDRFISMDAKKQEGPPSVAPGRNDPCWCGSGRKYKKCHLPDEERTSAEKACSLRCGPT